MPNFDILYEVETSLHKYNDAELATIWRAFANQMDDVHRHWLRFPLHEQAVLDMPDGTQALSTRRQVLQHMFKLWLPEQNVAQILERM